MSTVYSKLCTRQGLVDHDAGRDPRHPGSDSRVPAVTEDLPPELLNNDPHGFAWGVWHDRAPRLVAQIRDAHPYGPAQRDALAALLAEISAGVMQPLDPGAADH